MMHRFGRIDTRGVLRGFLRPVPAHAGVGVTPERGSPAHIFHLRARVSRNRGRLLATLTGHGGNLSP